MSVGGDGLPQLVTCSGAPPQVICRAAAPAVTSHCEVRCLVQWKVHSLYSHLHIVSLLRGSVSSYLAQEDIWSTAQSALWTSRPFTDDTKWCEARVQNISSCRVFIWSKSPALCQFGSALLEVRPFLSSSEKCFKAEAGQPQAPATSWNVSGVWYSDWKSMEPLCVCILWTRTKALSLWLWEKRGLWLSLTMILWEVALVVFHYWIKKAETFPPSPPAPATTVSLSPTFIRSSYILWAGCVIGENWARVRC